MAAGQLTNWKDEAIRRAEVISDAWEVVKAYTGRGAEWVLFICMVINLVQVAVPVWPWLAYGTLVMQSIMLDIAGFGLATIAEYVRRMGDEEAASRAQWMGWALISLMIASLTSVTIRLLFPDTKQAIEYIDDGLVLARVVATVFYGHVMHSLRSASQHHQDETRERELALRKQITELQAKVQQGERSIAQAQRDNNMLSQQLADAESTLCRLPRLQEQIAEIGQDKQSASEKLQLAQQNVNSLSDQLQTAKLQIADLQFRQKSSANLQKANEELAANAQALQLQNADLAVKLQTAKSRISELQNADRETAKSPANITPIENARSMKNGSARKFTHAEVLEFKASHPTLKNAEVATQLGISERKVYEAIAWQKDQSADENAVEATC